MCERVYLSAVRLIKRGAFTTTDNVQYCSHDRGSCTVHTLTHSLYDGLHTSHDNHTTTAYNLQPQDSDSQYIHTILELV